MRCKARLPHAAASACTCAALLHGPIAASHARFHCARIHRGAKRLGRAQTVQVEPNPARGHSERPEVALSVSVNVTRYDEIGHSACRACRHLRERLPPACGARIWLGTQDDDPPAQRLHQASCRSLTAAAPCRRRRPAARRRRRLTLLFFALYPPSSRPPTASHGQPQEQVLRGRGL